MSEDSDVLSKVDALLKRHQPASPVESEIPTLTEVLEETVSEATGLPVLTEIVAQSTATPEAMPAEPLHAASPEAAAPASLDSKLLERMIAEKVNEWLERSMPEKLAQLDVYAEDLVQDAVTQEVVKHMELLARDMTKLVQEEIRKALAGALPPDRGGKT